MSGAGHGTEYGGGSEYRNLRPKLERVHLRFGEVVYHDVGARRDGIPD